MTDVSHIRGETFHGRRGAVDNAFRYSVDYLLLDAEAAVGPTLFSRNRVNLAAIHDRDHGGKPGAGRGAAWVRDRLRDYAFEDAGARIRLLAQPRVFGHVFNPVSFWLCEDREGNLRAVIAEVSNTFGDRHCYFCRRDDKGAITRHDVLEAAKIFHVSPFQPIGGSYRFRFDIRPDRIGIWIDFQAGEHGLFATLTGHCRPATNASLLWTMLRRPFGSRRVLGLIHWQALKLWRKGARWHVRPEPPAEEVSS
ncbi:MAG: DUF1365 domain-containing protein [Pseudomonadota bacterium]